MNHSTPFYNKTRSQICKQTQSTSTTQFLQRVSTFLIATALSACSNQAVDPVVPSRELTVLCIDTAEKVGAQYAQEIEGALDDMGIASRMTGGAFPGECVHRLQTRVVWANALIPYIISLELAVTENGRSLGDATYSVGQAYRTPERFGSAASKAKPLLKEMLVEYIKEPVE